jgi:isopenicillin-N epimerase
VVVPLPFPLGDPQQVVDALVAAVTPRTRLALVDHITSQTGMVLPIDAIVSALQARGVDTLVDGAHAPGMVELSLRALQPAYYTANLHKWCCGPKGAAFLYVRPDKQPGIHPLNISHGYRPEGDFDGEFMWTGTQDPTPWLCIPAALDAMAALHPEGWSGVRAHNRALALAGRRLILDALNLPVPCPDSMIGAMASFWLPDASQPLPAGVLPLDPTQTWLWDTHRIEVPIVPWPRWPKRLMRISAQLYNEPADYRRLAEALTACPSF